MNRFAARVLLTAGCVCLLAAPATGQGGLKERTLSDTPAPSQAPAPAPMAPATSPPGAATVAPAPMPTPLPGQSPAAIPPASGAGTQARPAPPPTQIPVQETTPAVPPPPPDGTPINGHVHGAPPPPPPMDNQPGGMPPSPGGTPINGRVNVTPPPPPPPPPPNRAQTYNRNEVNREVMGFFDSGSRGLAELVARAFRDLGQPAGFIKGNEAGGALVVGLRYGTGTLYLKGQRPVPVYWQSPSLGFDLGVNAVRVFTLVYGMTRPDEIFRRYPGVDGSAYILGGFGMNYQRTDGITLAPIRFGVGLRLGANVGYQHYTRTQEINPF